MVALLLYRTRVQIICLLGVRVDIFLSIAEIGLIPRGLRFNHLPFPPRLAYRPADRAEQILDDAPPSGLDFGLHRHTRLDPIAE